MRKVEVIKFPTARKGSTSHFGVGGDARSKNSSSRALILTTQEICVQVRYRRDILTLCTHSGIPRASTQHPFTYTWLRLRVRNLELLFGWRYNLSIGQRTCRLCDTLTPWRCRRTRPLSHVTDRRWGAGATRCPGPCWCPHSWVWSSTRPRWVQHPLDLSHLCQSILLLHAFILVPLWI